MCMQPFIFGISRLLSLMFSRREHTLPERASLLSMVTQKNMHHQAIIIDILPLLLDIHYMHQLNSNM